MNEKERDLLNQVRAQAILVAKLRERLAQESPTALRSIRMDGMPRSGAQPSGLDAALIRREEMARILRMEQSRLSYLERKARPALAHMKPELYAFCALYYLRGVSLADTALAIDRSERQCLRYKQDIDRGDCPS